MSRNKYSRARENTKQDLSNKVVDGDGKKSFEMMEAFTNSPLAIENLPTNHRISFAKQRESFGNDPRPFVVLTMVLLFLHLLVHHLQRPLIYQPHFCLLLSHYFLDQNYHCDLKSLPQSDSWQRHLAATVHLNDESHLQDFASSRNA
ncbi:hypothetical protein T01_12255 [Trichinella spiralis]|uniref:Uncharacterized protein n=1 Tax=Trichinella spiralis TaxID=6334 RepID=A0A0V1BY92_TRISP|nr:hypothetical protein T01_12255 [Trichinella spiralis]